MEQGNGHMVEIKGEEFMVEIKDAYKRYSTNVILRGLKMTVKKGTIYGLLGPSGCGKTTLLGCVAGRHSLDSGRIDVRLGDKRQLGYMPQEIALTELFTVAELVWYFGRMAGLRAAEAEAAGRRLLEMLELPPEHFWNRQIAQMSGGQQRRVSLMMALLHDPLLLILDEPTAGLDPLISHKLWQYFLEITGDQGKTIIITTHYIEEARQAHTIGLMRKGVLLSEASPGQLLETYKECEALEDVFLLLSMEQSTVGVKQEQEDYPKKRKFQVQIGKKKAWDKDRMAAQIYKSTCWVRRNVPMTLFMLALPLVLSLLFCNTLSDSMDVSVAAHSGEVASCHRNYSSPSRCKQDSFYSCRMLEFVRQKYRVVEFGDESGALQAVRSGLCRAALVFPANYSTSLVGLLEDGALADDSYLESGAIEAHVDMSDMIIGHKMKRDIVTSFKGLAEYVAVDCGYDARMASLPLQFKTPVFGDSEPKFAETALSGFVLPFVFYFTLLFSASSLASEKLTGFYERCLISGVQQTEIFFAHTVNQFLVAVCQNFVLLTTIYSVYSFPVKGSFALLCTFIGMAELQGMLFGYLLGIFFDNQNSISYVSSGIVICLYLSCGMVWPLEGVHWTLKWMLDVSPIAMAAESYRSVSARGWGLRHPRIQTTLAVNLLLTLVIFALFVVTAKLKNR